MKNLQKLITFTITLCLVSFSSYAQTCDGAPFSSPGAPATCTYTYTSSGWDVTPPNSIPSSASICILDDNATNFSIFKGDLYIAPGVTYSGDLGTANSDVTMVIAGTFNYTSTPNISGSEIYIETTGVFNITGNYAPGGSAILHNAGNLNVSGNLSLGGSATIIGYSNSNVVIQGNATISNTFKNCGLFEVVTGSLTTTGSVTLDNQCATYVHNDMTLLSDLTSNGLLIVDGTFSLNGTFTNNSILFVNNLSLSNDHVIGNDDNSLLIVQNVSTLGGGSSVTGTYYYDLDNGGGLDSVCGTCTEDIDIVTSITLPPTISEILEDCGAGVIINPIIEEALIDFDGVDDYLDSTFNFSGQQQATIMAWFKLDSFFSGPATILNQGGVEIAISNGKQLSATVNGVTLNFPGSTTVKLNEWTHVTAIFNSSLPSKQLKIYFNGTPVGNSTDNALTSTITTSSDLLTIGKKSASNTNYFTGDIDEVRLFDVALTEDQMQKIIYQEIVESANSVSGLDVPKTIVDYTTEATISWANLKAYYPMTDILSYTRTTDFSGNGHYATLHNITTILEQTAPMPFQSSSDGNWNNAANWLHGDVWNMSELSTSGYSIAKISHDLAATASLKTLALLVDSDKTITMNGTNQISNSWYLGLDGTLDLKNDSQLVQGKQSDLVTSAEGKILRRQEGQTNMFRYNYWSAPVGVKQATTYTDNNNEFAANPNNTPFTLSMLKDNLGNDVQFTNAYHEDGKISSFWLYSFVNGVTYYDWAALNINTPLVSGLGYTQKGGGDLSEYIFEGKPNNGTIIINATDTGGPGSDGTAAGGYTRTQTLVGNPYPSAIDGHQFIIDNASTIGGEIYLWEQWDGDSHNLAQYQGGYAVLNLLDQVNAYQFKGLEGGNTGVSSGQITPKQYLPVGQGFMVEVKFDGEIKFLNTQRLFKEEGVESVFFRTTNTTESTTDTAPVFQKIRLDFRTNTDLGRELVLGFSDSTTDEFDYGYDAKAHETNVNDLTMPLESKQMIMQAFSPITADKEVDLNFKSNGNFTYTIEATQLENIDASQEVYLRDNLTGVYHDLTTNQAYSFTSEAGTFNDRFDVVFQTEAALSNEDFDTNDNTLVYYNNTQDLLFVKGLTQDAKDIKLYNTLGQEVYNNVSITNQQLENGLSFSALSTGLYVVSITTDNNQTIDKKIIIE